jgi:hypothetical protein
MKPLLAVQMLRLRHQSPLALTTLVRSLLVQ